MDLELGCGCLCSYLVMGDTSLPKKPQVTSLRQLIGASRYIKHVCVAFHLPVFVKLIERRERERDAKGCLLERLSCRIQYSCGKCRR